MANNECSAIVVYWSATGNTKKVAEAIFSTLKYNDLNATIADIRSGTAIDHREYNLVFLGAPVYGNLPPEPVTAFLSELRRKSGHAHAAAPELPGRFAVPFCTYGGGHTGYNEAVPMLKYIGQTFEHTGIRVVDEWAVLGEYQAAGEDYNKAGRLGVIEDRPDSHDLADIRGKTDGLLRRLKLKLELEL